MTILFRLCSLALMNTGYHWSRKAFSLCVMKENLTFWTSKSWLFLFFIYALRHWFVFCFCFLFLLLFVCLFLSVMFTFTAVWDMNNSASVKVLSSSSCCWLYLRVITFWIYLGEYHMFSKLTEIDFAWDHYPNNCTPLYFDRMNSKGIMKPSWSLYVEAINKYLVLLMHPSPVAEGAYISLSCLYKIQASHTEISL